VEQSGAGPRRARLIEAGVIMFSILAAFAVDAWWDASKQKGRAQAEVASLVTEFEAVDRELVRANQELQNALNATLTLARLAGPRPAPLAPDSFARLFNRSLTINAVELPTGALANILSSGDLNILGDLELQAQLASWPSIASLMAVKFGNLVINRDATVLPLTVGLVALSPTLSAAFGKAWPDDHQFPFDSGPLLGSREFENIMTSRWIHIQVALYTVIEAKKAAATIRAGLADWQ
jgi:hypothetical protein